MPEYQNMNISNSIYQKMKILFVLNTKSAQVIYNGGKTCADLECYQSETGTVYKGIFSVMNLGHDLEYGPDTGIHVCMYTMYFKNQ